MRVVAFLLCIWSRYRSCRGPHWSQKQIQKHNTRIVFCSNIEFGDIRICVIFDDWTSKSCRSALSALFALICLMCVDFISVDCPLNVSSLELTRDSSKFEIACLCRDVSAQQGVWWQQHWSWRVVVSKHNSQQWVLGIRSDQISQKMSQQKCRLNIEKL